MKAIIGKKVGMSQIFDENGHVIPVTVIEAGPCTVVQKKTSEKEGYNAVQLGFEDVAEKKLTKGEMGHLNKAGVSPKKHLREFDLDNAAELNIGDIVKADHRHQQGPRLPGRYQALERTAHPHQPRRRPCPSSRWLHGLFHRSFPHLQGQDRRRPHGRGSGDCPEPVRCEG